MDSWWYALLPFFVFFLILFLQRGEQKKRVAANIVQRKKEKNIMRELAKRFVGKDCIITLIDGSVDGIISEVTDGGLVVEKDEKKQAVNLDYVVKIREYPYNKKGKRASIVGE